MNYINNDFVSNKFNISPAAFRIGEAALLGMLYEVSSSPSPGLVSPFSNGAHEDMDFFTFLSSTSAIAHSMYLCAQAGIDYEKEDILNHLRPIGIEAERRMYKATGGVNTQKGILFLAGIACASAGRCVRKGIGFKREAISNECKEICRGIVDRELGAIGDDGASSNGESIYKKYGFDGIRGEVQRGIPTAISTGLPAYEEALAYGLDTKEALCHSLVNIMAVVDDTNVLSRRGFEGLMLMREYAKRAVELGGMKTREGYDSILKMEEIFRTCNISPGGAADLLAVTVMIHKLERDGLI